MAITVQGVKVQSVSIGGEEEDPNKAIKMTGSYALMSSAGKILAKQGFNGYNDMKIDMTRETTNLLSQFLLSLTKDINATLGLEGGDK